MSHQERAELMTAASSVPHWRKAGWIYLLAAPFPGLLAIPVLISNFPIQGYESWLATAAFIACIARVVYPTRVLSVVVFLWYAKMAALLVWRHWGAFHDYWAYSGEHTSWEGWQFECQMLAFTAFLLLITWQLGRHVVQRRSNAT
jgi:hypothetical protein